MERIEQRENTWKAALEGAKIVTSLKPSNAEPTVVWFNAPAKAVSPLSTADMEGGRGRVRTVSMIWMIPPVNMISY